MNMRKYFCVISAILFLAVSQAGAAGSWSPNLFSYRPGLSTQGTIDYGNFNTSQDRIDARLGEIIYVTDPNYGAVGNGVADDTVALQSAIDAINLRGGGVVFFPKGTYKISSQLSPCANLTLEGVKSQSKLKITNSGGYGLFWHNVDNITIRNLDFYSTDDANVAREPITFYDSNNVLIENCEISYFLYNGVHNSGGSNNVTIRNNHIHHINTLNMPEVDGGHNAIGSAGWSNVLMDGNYINDIGCGRWGGDWGYYDYTLTGTTSENVTFSNNVVKDCEGGIQATVSGLLRHLTITGNKIVGTTAVQSIAINYAVEEFVIADNIITPADTNPMTYHLVVRSLVKNYVIANNVVNVPVGGSNYGCIYVAGEKGVVSNNTIYGNGGLNVSVGVSVGAVDSQDISIHGNMIYNCSTGVWISKGATTCQGIRVTNNYIKGPINTDGFGVRMGSTLASQVIISNNYIDTALAAVKAMGTDILIENNTVFNVQYLMQGLTCTRVLAQNNIALDTVLVGAYYGTPTGPGGEDFRVLNTRRTPDNGVVTLANSATPAVGLGTDFKTGGTTTITNLPQGFVGQTIRLMAKHTVTISNNANANDGFILTTSGSDISATAGKVYTLTMFDQGTWQQM